MPYRPFHRGRESGAALIVALIFLLLMTLLSTSSMRTSTMQERMAGNSRDWNIGFQSAEAALRVAEDYLYELDELPNFSDSAGLYHLNSNGRPDWTDDPLDAGSGVIDVAIELEGVPKAHYYIEHLSSVHPAGVATEMPTVEQTYYFRVTAVGYGMAVDGANKPLTAVVLQSVYRSR